MNRKLVLALSLSVLFFGVLFLAGFVPLHRREAALRAEANRLRDAPQQVTVEKPRRAPDSDDVLLPGAIEPIEQTTINARVNGYLKHWRVDIGDQVAAGALLAEIETPELDQERRQAEAAVAQLRAKLLSAEANVRLAESTHARYQGAAERGGVSPQQLAESKAAVETAQAAVEVARQDIAAGEANLQRLVELTSFAKVRAPFAGTITRRTIDTGGLVTAGNGNNQALFQLASVDPVRVFVHVPQMYAPAVVPKISAELVVREYPGRTFTGRVTRSAGALDPASRTLLTQIEVPNPDHALLPGMYAQARLKLPRAGAGLRIPARALVVRAEGTQVALVVAEDRVHFQKVRIAEDYGTEIAVEGLTDEAKVIVDPTDRLVEGAVVRLATSAPPAASPPPAPPAPERKLNP